MREVQDEVVVTEVRGVKPRRISSKATRWSAPRIHVFYGKDEREVLLVKFSNAFFESTGIVALPAEGRVDDDEPGAEPSRSFGGFIQLAPRVTTPHIWRDEQTRRMDRRHCDAILSRQIDDPVNVCGDWIDTDHQLDSVITDSLSASESVGGRLRVDRGRRQRHTGGD